MRVLLFNTIFLLIASFLGVSIYEGLSDFPLYFRVPSALIITYFLLLLLLLSVNLTTRLFLRNTPDFLDPGTFRRFVWGVSKLARENYTNLIHCLGFISGNSNLALRLIGLKHGKRLTVIDSQINDPSRVTIGNNVLVGTDVTIGEKFHPFHGKVDRRPIVIGNNCLIGGRAIIQNGTRIGDNVVLGVLSVVPSGAILESGWTYGGNPAKKIRPIESHITNNKN